MHVDPGEFFPKAGAPSEEPEQEDQKLLRKLAAQRLERSLLALSTEEAQKVVAKTMTLDELRERAEEIDLEYKFAKSFLADVLGTPNPRAKAALSAEDQGLREFFEKCVRQQLFWLDDIDRRRREIRDSEEGEPDEGGQQVLVSLGGGDNTTP